MVVDARGVPAPRVPPGKHDPVVEAVRADLLSRSKIGIEKYGTTLARSDLTQKQWLQHLYEEILDAANYAKRLIMDLERRKAEDRAMFGEGK